MTVTLTHYADPEKFMVDVTAVFSWNVNYAAYVHEGVVTKNGGVIPARPWVRVALREFDFDGTFIRLLTEYGDAERAFRETCELLGVKFTQLITSAIWNWSNTTKRYGDGAGGKRRTPIEVRSPRDIVDTGRLRSSQRLEFV